MDTEYNAALPLLFDFISDFSETELADVTKVLEDPSQTDPELLTMINNDDLEVHVIDNSAYNNEENAGTDMLFDTINCQFERSFVHDEYYSQWQYCERQSTAGCPELLKKIFSDSSSSSDVIGNCLNANDDFFGKYSSELNDEVPKNVNINEKDTAKITVNTIETDIEAKTKQQIKEEEFKYPISLPQVLSQGALNHTTKNANIKKKNQNEKGRRKKKEDSITINEKVKSEEQKDCVLDIEASERVTALYQSLLEQVEASANLNPCNKLTVKDNRTCDTRSDKTCQVTQKCQASASNKSILQASNQQKDVRTSLPKDLIHTIKDVSKRGISLISPMPNINKQDRKRSNIRMQDGAPRNKILKTSSTITNNVKNKTFNTASVQLDHDYCGSENIHTKNESNETIKHTSVLKSNQNKNWKELEKLQNNINSNKHCNLKSTNICDTSEKPVVLQNKQTDKIKDNVLTNNSKDCQKEIPLKQLDETSKVSPITVPDISICPKVTIRSGLAKRILRKNILSTNTIAQTTANIPNNAQTYPKTQPMISVLKKIPPNASQLSFSTNNFNESIVTVTNSLNVIQNIIVPINQDTLPHEVVMKTVAPRTKINLAEYRSRKEQNRNDNSKTNPPMKLVDVHHASTTTEPIKDDPKNPIWCEREIIPVWKVKSDMKEETNKSKPLTCDIGTQTYETTLSTKSSVDVVEKDEKSKKSTKNEKQNRRHSLSRSLSRSRSKSRSENKNRGRRKNRSSSKSKSKGQSKSKTRRKSRTRSRSINTNSRSRTRSKSRSRSRSRSRSCARRRRSNTRRRTISHRRSSVSSTSSWSSRSRYTSTSTRSRYSYSRSRSGSRVRSRSSSRSRSRSSSRSRSPAQYNSNYSRSSYNSNGKNRWNSYRRKHSSNCERNYDRYSRSFTNGHYRNRRSPLRCYDKPYNWYNREKQKEVEDRKVVYVGRIDEGVTKAHLRQRFEVFGPIVDISVHFRERGDNYGFVTFMYKEDAFRALEHGNDNTSLPQYDLCFGGRRAFCRSKYADLDDMKNSGPIGRRPQTDEENTFDFLLKQAQATLRKRKV